MSKKLKTLLYGAIILSASLSLSGCGTKATIEETSEKEQKNSFSKMIAFGDSYSDNGSAFAISSAIVASGEVEGAYVKPGDLYYENRYSNGKVAVEIAAEKASLPLINYATGGALSGQENYSAWMDSEGNTGVLGQIDKYIADLGENTATESDLFFIMSGTNDYCKFIDFELDGTLFDVANETLSNTEKAIRSLSEVGAKHIVISEANDVSIMPYEITEGRSESAKEYAQTVNAKLPEMVASLEKELNIDIEIFELTKLTSDIVADPNKYGFTEHEKVIQATWPEVLPAETESLESYMFFDEWHPSAQMHQYIGEGIIKTIEKMSK